MRHLLKQTTNVTLQAVTKHLQVLQVAGIVQSKRVGRDRLWQIEVKRLVEIRSYLEQISAEWDASLDRLRLFVERDGK